MLHPGEFPLVLSPSLGCPQFVFLAAGQGSGPISALVASREAAFGQWSLVPSSSNRDPGLGRILLVVEDVREIPGIPHPCSSVGETREIVSQELLVGVFGGDARVFKVLLSLSAFRPDRVLRRVKDEFRPTLYDLCLDDRVSRRKMHAVCLTPAPPRGVRFIHLVDLHLARRNDLIESEVAVAVGTVGRFNNFNDRLRGFVEKANGMADRGELDFVILGGDLVDFVNQGVSDGALDPGNNWEVFTEIVTGGGSEGARGNTGLRVPVFTTTGNHDWRFHPYDVADAASTFGLTDAEAGHFDFEYNDTVERLEAKRNEVFERIVREGSPISKENLLHAAAKRILGYSRTWQAKVLVPVVSAVPGLWIRGFGDAAALSAPLIAGAIHYAVNRVLAAWVREMVSRAIVPIEAGARALHGYFLNINPFFNYAVSYGSNYFVMMDTGPDCFTGQYLWDGGNKKMARLSIPDNLLGGVPDSMAFYPANEYYSPGQIVWLERVLAAIRSEGKGKTRIFVCLHAPPVNVKKAPAIPAGKDEVLLEQGRISVHHGTINHYASQFLHLCRGEKEADPAYSGPVVDLVLSGHAHWNAEFRVAPGMRIYYGGYSGAPVRTLFDDERPFLVQTAACGPLSPGYPDPPYFRTVHVDQSGTILRFD
ncbi:MAG: metallophosphoesterase [Nitrospirae bacterium]|nr:metallophosphoesterase [Nitrospirota bacterium]